MTTAVIGLGSIGHAVAKHLVNGGEEVLVSTRHLEEAKEIADELGAKAVSTEDAIEQADTIIFAVPFTATKKTLQQHKDKLSGKVIIDPSNPIAPDDNGRYHRLLPAGISSSEKVREDVPADAHYAKGMNTLLADTLDSSANHDPKVALFYVTEDDKAEKEITRLIDLMGYTPMKAGGLKHAIDIEVGGQLHEKGGLEHNLPVEEMAKDALKQASKYWDS